MIAISLLYFWCKSYVAIIKHKKITIYSIFQICSFLEIQENVGLRELCRNTVYVKPFKGENLHGFCGFLLTTNVLPLKIFLE